MEGRSEGGPSGYTWFHCRTRVFCTVGSEMLTGDSVGEGWDQLERTGPKEVRQVTLGSVGTGPKEDRQVTLGSEG